MLAEAERRAIDYLLRLASYSLGTLKVDLAKVSTALSVTDYEFVEIIVSLEAKGLVQIDGLKLPSTLSRSFYLQLLNLETSFVRNAVDNTEHANSRGRLTYAIRRLSDLGSKLRVEPLPPSEGAAAIQKREELLDQLAKKEEDGKESVSVAELNQKLAAVNGIINAFKDFWRNLAGDLTAPDSMITVTEEQRAVALLFCLNGAAPLRADVDRSVDSELEVLKVRHLVGELDKKTYERQLREFQSLIEERRKLRVPSRKEFTDYLNKTQEKLSSLDQLHSKGLLTSKNFNALAGELKVDIGMLEDFTKTN